MHSQRERTYVYTYAWTLYHVMRAATTLVREALATPGLYIAKTLALLHRIQTIFALRMHAEVDNEEGGIFPPYVNYAVEMYGDYA